MNRTLSHSLNSPLPDPDLDPRPDPLPNPQLHSLGIAAATIINRGLIEFTEPAILELLEMGNDGREHRLTPQAAAAWRSLKAAALADGLTLMLVSGFRSVQRQVEIIEGKLAAGQNIDDILNAVAPPGYSEHHTGRAIDIASLEHPDLAITFADTPEYQWLCNHAAQFGFTLSFPEGNASGYQYEPWHWCFH